MVNALMFVSLFLTASAERPTNGDAPAVIKEVISLTDGYHRAGCWHPFEVVLLSARSFEGELHLEGEGVDIAVRVHLQPGKETSALIPFLGGRGAGGLVARLRTPDAVVAERRYEGRLTLLGEQELLIGVGGGRTTPHFAALATEYVGIDNARNAAHLALRILQLSA